MKRITALVLAIFIVIPSVSIVRRAQAAYPRTQPVNRPDVYVLMVAGIGSHSAASQDDGYFGSLPSALENALTGYGYSANEAHFRVLYLSYAGADPNCGYTCP